MWKYLDLSGNYKNQLDLYWIFWKLLEISSASTHSTWAVRRRSEGEGRAWEQRSLEAFVVVVLVPCLCASHIHTNWYLPVIPNAAKPYFFWESQEDLMEEGSLLDLDSTPLVQGDNNGFVETSRLAKGTKGEAKSTAAAASSGAKESVPTLIKDSFLLERPLCQFGFDCTIVEPTHFVDFRHTALSDKEKKRLQELAAARANGNNKKGVPETHIKSGDERDNKASEAKVQSLFPTVFPPRICGAI